MGKRVKVGRVDEFSHVVWADKLECLSKALKDDSGLLIRPIVRRSMPRELKLLVGHPASYMISILQRSPQSVDNRT